MRARVLRQNNIDQRSADGAFSDFNVPRVYAALGDPDFGDTPKRISERCNLPLDVVSRTLGFMTGQGWVQEIEGRFKANEDQVLFAEQKARGDFQRFYVDLLSRSTRAAKISFNDDEQLFFGSCLSVRTEDLPRLRNQLSQVLARFIERCERSDGDRVVSIALALFK